MTSSRPWLLLLFAISAALVFTFGAVGDEADLVRARMMLSDSGFPENDETRRLMADAIEAPSYPAVETPYRINRQISDNRIVHFELRKTVRDWYLIFRNQRGLEPRETYPLWGRGTWIIKKDLLTGAFVQAKIFLQDDEDSFVRIFPMDKGRSRLDVHLYGRQLGDDVVIPVPFESLMTSPFARIAALTDHSVDWGVLFPNPDALGYRRTEDFVNQLAGFDRLIQEVDDAAVNGAGENVYIEDGEAVRLGAPVSGGGSLSQGQTGLNCSGYVKWVADGIYSGWTGSPGSRHLDLEELRVPTSRTNRNPWSESRSASGPDARGKLESLLRDPHFGLDWNRNLARIIEETRLGRSLSDEEIAVLDTGELPGVPYRRDLGYPIDDLDSVLYQLASKRPGAVYFAAVNSRFVPPPSPEDPDPIPLHQYWHVSILAPWFDEGAGERGRFRVAVLDVGDVSESLLDDPMSDEPPKFPAAILENAVRYADLGKDDQNNILVPEVSVHLVRVDLPPRFMASPLPAAR
jgi:hypothetical protein